MSGATRDVFHEIDANVVQPLLSRTDIMRVVVIKLFFFRFERPSSAMVYQRRRVSHKKCNALAAFAVLSVFVPYERYCRGRRLPVRDGHGFHTPSTDLDCCARFGWVLRVRQGTIDERDWKTIRSKNFPTNGRDKSKSGWVNTKFTTYE